MRTYLELKDHVADPPHSYPTYSNRPNTPTPQKLQASRTGMVREPKKRNKNHQVGRRQYKVRIIGKPLLLSRISATSAPRTTVITTTTTTLFSFRNSSVGRAVELHVRGPGFKTHSQLNLARVDSAFHPFVGR